MNIRDNVKAFCKLRSITQKELAEKIGMKENTFNVALGKSTFNIPTLEKISTVFGITVSELLAENIEHQDTIKQVEANAKVLRCPHCGEEIELYVKTP